MVVANDINQAGYMPKKKSKKKIVKTKPKSEQKIKHPWRHCPPGRHWVRTFDRDVKVSKKNPDGTTSVEEHCRDNPSHKDHIYTEELDKISQEYFPKLTGAPNPKNLGYKNGNQFDDIIRGWTEYWNEVFKSSEPLDADLIKALIATESSFEPNSVKDAGKHGKARGLMQLTDDTLRILSDKNGELTDHLITVDQNEANDPNSNISAGIRWLFQKKRTASSRLGREATWVEAVAEYKGILKSYKKTKKSKRMNKFHSKYKKLKS